jgi:hypothetical protein
MTLADFKGLTLTERSALRDELSDYIDRHNAALS